MRYHLTTSKGEPIVCSDNTGNTINMHRETHQDLVDFMQGEHNYYETLMDLQQERIESLEEVIQDLHLSVKDLTEENEDLVDTIEYLRGSEYDS
jgi:predicted RNase H-like nuclease (RuvC/YqgF family)